MGTRWSSSFTDPQAIIVDLGATYSVDEEDLYWEVAFGKEYYLKASKAGGSWFDVRHETSGDGGLDRIPVNANMRKVMMFGVQRGTSDGYSRYELEVHGTTAAVISDAVASVPAQFDLCGNYPIPSIRRRLQSTASRRFAARDPASVMCALWHMIFWGVKWSYWPTSGRGRETTM